MGYSWPGNVRELRNVIESMVVMDADGVLDVDDLTEDLQQAASSGRSDGACRRRHPGRQVARGDRAALHRRDPQADQRQPRGSRRGSWASASGPSIASSRNTRSAERPAPPGHRPRSRAVSVASRFPLDRQLADRIAARLEAIAVDIDEDRVRDRHRPIIRVLRTHDRAELAIARRSPPRSRGCRARAGWVSPGRTSPPRPRSDRHWTGG